MERGLKNSYTVDSDALDTVYDYWQQTSKSIQWSCLFVLPCWLKVWWKNFNQGAKLYLLSIRQEDRTIGIAPFQRKGKTVQFIGDENVCDHLDFIVTPENTTAFYRVLINHLKQDGVKNMDLGPVRRDSSVFAKLLPAAEKEGCRLSYEHINTSFELELPNNWDDYLLMLSSKERHENRRKLRRLNEAGQVKFRRVDETSSVKKEMETFLTLFKANRSDKAVFMTDQMVSFFKDMAQALATVKILKLFFLELDGRPVAASMCFDYQSTMYLYNNGYDKNFSSLSVGLLSKVLSIKESIQSGKKTYDFLKGAEVYKQRMGGQPVQLYRCVIEFT
ncbi:MAG: GNAT family N-acetyltransferase [Deltaproteobacteria bacterium]|nr:GNAT family N-acetyltransferase [Deltaproteobacteria bacterium]